ncbi:ribonuclease HI family protein [Filobacillus milosensis]|uniref:Ribonuclease HI family protein n=1 Tax=Filobacillus milosensis TaxID=94137 RepID=A0A4Y8IN01_9BACI|nr:ribonuclease HI family protein [Filobacillus milosensis]TFB22797.1 ribonuclease HI family protein [Filobacillus milosensis]
MIEVYVDGASKGNPGISGAGVYIKAKGHNYEYSFPLGTLSNHEAEFMAVIKALDICQELYPEEILSFRSDSQIVVNAIEEGYTKNRVFQPLLEEIKEKASTFPIYFIKWIPNKKNHHADRLAKQAIHES